MQPARALEEGRVHAQTVRGAHISSPRLSDQGAAAPSKVPAVPRSVVAQWWPTPLGQGKSVDHGYDEKSITMSATIARITTARIHGRSRRIQRGNIQYCLGIMESPGSIVPPRLTS